MHVENIKTSSSVAVLGAVNLDRLARVEWLPRPGETLLARDSAQMIGGKAANQAVAAARQGVNVRLISAVGDDAEGSWLRSQLAAFGVDTARVRTARGLPSGSAQIWVEAGGENVIVVILGANAALTPEDARSAPPAAVRLAQLESPLETVEAFLSAPGAALRILNAAPATPVASSLLPLADVLVVNELELALLSGVGELDGREAVVAAARALRARPAQVVVATLGARGALAVAADAVLTVAPRPVRAVDTTGAGDCFCGVLAAALSEGASLASALERASLAASVSVTRRGTSASMPTRAEVDALLGAGG